MCSQGSRGASLVTPQKAPLPPFNPQSPLFGDANANAFMDFDDSPKPKATCVREERARERRCAFDQRATRGSGGGHAGYD
jgi:hypothetical protein